MNKTGLLFTLSAVLIGEVSSVALAQPSTLQRLEALESQEQKAKAAEDAK